MEGQKSPKGKPGGKGKGNSGSADSAEGSGAFSLSDGDDISGGTLTAAEADQSAILADGVTAELSEVTVDKNGGDASSADASSFRGVNAAVRVINDADVTITDSVINSSAKNATAVFAYNGGTIHISDSTVTSIGGGAGGIQVAGGGVLYANNLTVTSSGKAAIRSDRGGGTMIVDGGTYTALGPDGCPAIYSTAEITVSNATLTAEASQAVIIEGKNSVMISNCEVSGNDEPSSKGTPQSCVMIFQSASGDAEAGTGNFTMTGGSLTANQGSMFYISNTNAVIELTGVELHNSADDDLLIAGAGRWGKEGSNGGNCTFTANDETLEGNISVDSISSLILTLNDSTYTGAVNTDGTAGEVNVKLGSDSQWTLTGDSYITSFDGDLDDVVTNGYTLYVDGVKVK